MDTKKRVKRAILEENALFLKKNCEMFCWFQKSSYLCTRKNANNGYSKQPNGAKQKT